MICYDCKEANSKVLHTRIHPNGQWLRRRRECECGNRWWTVEVPEADLTEVREEE